MRLGRIKVHGFRKIVASECTTPGKLIAFVGPNEAGKSSLLSALLALDSPDAIPPADWPRGLDIDADDVALECWFRLDTEDLDAMSDVVTPVLPIWYVVSKKYDGGRIHALEPRPTRDYGSREAADKALSRFATTRAAAELGRRPDEDAEPQAGDLLDEVLGFVGGRSGISEEQLDTVQALIRHLEAAGSRGLGARAEKALAVWRADALQDHPHEISTKRLWPRRPRFAAFGEAERTLASDYDLRVVADGPPAALANLAKISHLDLEELLASVERQDAGAYVSATEDANARLAAVFTEAWQQSPVVVRLHLDAAILRVMVSNTSSGYSSIAERSDGLKAFVALTSFAAQEKESGRPMVLLIDEAEQHLHFDAQADLVRMLDRQGLAQQVIYTTHSPGCLPSDLGTGIRPVVPATDGGRSSLANSFWAEGRGFYPLLMALGAGAAAFAPSRYAVLAEGASDMLLLPSMIREAIKRESLDYQIAPGIAESSLSQLLALDLEAPRVAYLVDGDAGGAAHAKRLAAAGVPDERVVQLGGIHSGVTPEALLREEVYLQAVNETLQRVHGSTHGEIKAADLAGTSPSSAVDAWCEARQLSRLAKTVVAAVVLEQAASPLLAAHARAVLRTAHASLCRGLEIPP